MGIRFFDANFTVVVIDNNASRQGEAKPPTGGFGRESGGKNTFTYFFFDAWAIVFNEQLHFLRMHR